MEEPLHMAMQKYTDALCTTNEQTNLTTSLFQDISTFDGWDFMKFGDWLTDLKTATDILKKSQSCLAETESCSLTHILTHEALQAEKCWDDIKDILCLKLCNTEIHTYMSCFMEI